MAAQKKGPSVFGEAQEEASLPFISRRSAVIGVRGMVACSQPLAAEAGMRILQQGGNAADAAVAVAAALNVLEPCSTGIGGDAFGLFWDAKARKMQCMMGNGRSPSGLTMEAVRAAGFKGTALSPFHPLAVTVPGAAAAWEDAVKQWGRLPLAQVLQPAIELAEGGFAVGPVTAHQWAGCARQLKGPGAQALRAPDGGPPRAGQLIYNRDLAATLRSLAEHGAAKGFYSGRIAEAIVAALAEGGGVLSGADLAAHRTVFPDPISTTYRGHKVYEVPPPTQGIAALVALNILEQEPDFGGAPWGSGAHLHAQLSAMRLAFADVLQYGADPDVVHVPLDTLLSKEHAAERRASSHPDKVVPVEAASLVKPGEELPVRGNDTVYFCTVDGDGNGCSFINSNYMGFGTGIVGEGCGFTLQNRGANFILDPDHPNCLAPNKRPFHTIIPAAATTEGPHGEELFCTFGVMGGFMQPQGHMQVLSGMVDYGMEPQEALDAPRFRLDGVDSCIGPASVNDSVVYLEEGFSDEAVADLKRRGYQVCEAECNHNRIHFGRGQIIRRMADGVLWGGSDPRADGQVVGW